MNVCYNLPQPREREQDQTQPITVLKYSHSVARKVNNTPAVAPPSHPHPSSATSVRQENLAQIQDVRVYLCVLVLQHYNC